MVKDGEDWHGLQTAKLKSLGYVTKTNFIIFHPYQKHLNYDVNIKIPDNRVNKYFNLERKEYVKYLEVMIDNHLSWKHHINYVALKISRNIGILSKLRHFCSSQNTFRDLQFFNIPLSFLWPRCLGPGCKNSSGETPQITKKSCAPN